MKRDKNRRPTEAELDAITVDEHEAAHFEKTTFRVRAALDRARIPSTLDWCIVGVAWVAQVFAVQGMGKDFWRGWIETSVATWQGLEKKERGSVDRDLDAASLVPRMGRYRSALERGKLDPVDAEVCAAILSIGAQEFALCGVPPEHFTNMADAVFDMAEAKIVALAQAKGGKA